MKTYQNTFLGAVGEAGNLPNGDYFEWLTSDSSGGFLQGLANTVNNCLIEALVFEKVCNVTFESENQIQCGSVLTHNFCRKPALKSLEKFRFNAQFEKKIKSWIII